MNKPIAVKPMSAFGGLAILNVKYGIDDEVLVADCDENGFDNHRYHKVHYAGDRPYIIRNHIRHYIDDFMKM